MRWCYGIALNDLERPVISWVQVLGSCCTTREAYRRRETRRFRVRREPCLKSSIVPKGIKLLSSISMQPAQVSNNDCPIANPGRDTDRILAQPYTWRRPWQDCSLWCSFELSYLLCANSLFETFLLSKCTLVLRLQAARWRLTSGRVCFPCLLYTSDAADE